jgi:serine/threonine protein kinase/sugar lactone lactonase YvrE
MTAERWERVKELLHRAMQLAPERRGLFLDAACANDQSLRAEVQSLLMADDNVRSSFLQSAPGSGGSGADTAPIPSMPARLGPYEILGPLGRGGMGEVYRARDSRLRRSVAIKILRADLSRDPARQRRFEREARAASALNHPNIVSVYDIGRESDIPFIVSEFVEGESLRCLIARGPAPAAQVVAIGSQIATGLGAAHAAGIVHRDLKPENIMLTPDQRVKILDFGLAKHVPQHLETVRRTETMALTAPGVVVGTIGFLSPEQVRSEAVDQRSDIFSLGAVLYELAAGRPAFRRGNAMEVVMAIVREEPAPLPPDVPAALDLIIRRCLEKDPQRRFQNAASLAAALEGVVAVAPPSQAPQAAVPTPKRRSSLWVAAAILGLGSGVLVTSLLLDRRPQTATSPVARPAVTQTAMTPPAVTQPAAPQPVQPAAQPREHAARIPDVPRQTAPPAAPTPEPRTTVPTPVPVPVRTPVIELLAGRPWRFSGDGMPARQVVLGHCDDIKCDREGNIYVSDAGYLTIVKIDRNGILHVLASPELTPADRLVAPHGLVVDKSGAIYFAEVFVIRKLLPNGAIVPFVGNHTKGFTADGAPAGGSAVAEVTGIAQAADGSIFFSELSNRRVRRVDAQGRLQTVAGNGIQGFAGDGGPALRAALGGPRGLAFDRAGNLFIADSGNQAVRRVGLDGRITTVAGRGVIGNLACPSGLAFNQKDELFVADPCKRQVLVVRNGGITAVGGIGEDHAEPSGDGGPATKASFDQWAITFDQEENLLVTGPVYGHIYRIARDGTFKVVAGSGLWDAPRDATPASQALFDQPSGVAVDRAGNVFVSDVAANRIYRLDRAGIVNKVAGAGHLFFGYDGEGTPARNYRLNGPDGIRAGPRGNIVFADRRNNMVREVTAEQRLRSLAGNRDPGFSGDGGRAVDAALNSPSGVCLDSAGNVYIADSGNHRVRKVTPDGRIVTVAGNGTPDFSGDGGAAERAALKNPSAVEVDSEGNLYIADTDNHRVRRVSGGVISTLAGNGRPGYSGDDGPAANANLGLPADLALGPNRQLYVLDRPNHRVRKIDLASGIITTFAGNGDGTASGDGGPAVSAGLGRAGGIAVDAASNVYVTDLESKQLRIIRPGPR